MAQDTERTRPRYDAEVIKEIFIAVETNDEFHYKWTKTMNLVDRNNEYSGLNIVVA